MRGWPTIRDWLYSLAGVAGVVVLLALLMAPTGGFPSRPQFLEVKIRADDDQSLLVLEHIGEAANNRKWMWGTGGNGDPCMYFGTATDAGAPAASSVGFCRSGTTPLSVNFSPGADGVVSDHTGSGRQAAFVARGGAPALGLWIDDAGADNGEWDFKGTGTGDLTGRVLNDAHTVTTTWLTVNRTGTTVDLIDLAATSVTVNGAPIGGGPTVSESAPSGASMAVGQTILVSKSADTTRSNTIAKTADPHLQVTSLPAGHYLVRAHLVFTCAGVSCISVALTSPGSSLLMNGERVCPSGLTEPVNNHSTGLNPIRCATAGSGWFELSGGTGKAMATGTISIDWAQDTAVAENTTLESDSWLQVTRLN